jgi:amidophosphoribosyltransferase
MNKSDTITALENYRPKEECGVFGIYGHLHAANLTYLGLYSLQHRGQESAGIASSDSEHIYRYAGMGEVNDVFTQEHIDHLQGHMAIGHNRYSTTGSSFLRNAQPFRASSVLGPIVLSHNGNLTNAGAIRMELEKQGHIFQTTIDSEVIVHLMAKSGVDDFMEALIFALKKVKGAYSLLVMSKDKVYAVRDPHGFRPLALGRLGEAYTVASETCAFDIVNAVYERDVMPGELIEFSPSGIKSFFPFEKEEESLCVFEYIYFSRPDSRIFGDSVYDMRIKLGRMLAKQSPVEADIVVPIPDSSNCAALGYSKESGIPFELAMIRSHYIGRTFIEPTQRIRDLGVKLKFNVVESVVKDKRIVVVDDSIMRGTTMRKIIKMFRAAGAKEVHVRISAPPTKFPCFYGIDIPTHSELIAATHTIEEIKKYLRVDSISYMTVETLLEAVDRPGKKFCTACFDGNYPCSFENSTESEESQKYLFEEGNGEYY